MNLDATLMGVDFSKVFNSLHSRDGANTTCIWSSQINCYRSNDALQNTKAMARSPDGSTDFFEIVTEIFSTIFVYTLPRLCNSKID